MNDLTAFADLVRAMRAAQKKYFKTRLQSDLQRSKNLERQVDVQLEKIPARSTETAEQLVLPGREGPPADEIHAGSRCVDPACPGPAGYDVCRDRPDHEDLQGKERRADREGSLLPLLAAQRSPEEGY